MAPKPAHLEAWWLTTGLEPLSRLVDGSDIALRPSDVGYVQAIHRKLRAFDNDPALETSLRESMASIYRTEKAFPSGDFNPRRKMHEALGSVFRRIDEGGIKADRALDGLESLDVVEAHRQRLLAATRDAVRDGGNPDEHHRRLIEELDRQTTTRYRQFHMGLRACILMDALSQHDGRKPASEIMARLNALFPAFSILECETDVDITPYSAGLRDSIRFSVYEHLMGDNPHSPEALQAIYMREAMMRYSEEVKKLEDTCLAALGAMESTTGVGHARRRGSSTGSSFVAVSDGSKSLSPFVITPAVGSPTSTLAGMSRPSSSSARTSSRVASAPPVPNPLLKGMPGRELSASKTDGAAFAGDLTAPPILTYPDDLSTTEFDQHPLAREMNLSSAEKARLGLIIPKQIPSRDFKNKLDSDDEPTDEDRVAGKAVQKSPSKGLRAFRRFTGSKSDAPPVPPLPPIPESLKSTLTTKSLAKLFERRKLRNDLEEPEAVATSTASSGHKHATLSAAFGRSGGRPALKAKFSNPELRVSAGSGASHKASSSGSSGPLTPASSRSPSWPAHPSIDEQVETYAKVEKSPASFALVPPRISPMEYTRTYLLEKAAAQREGRACELPAPEQAWHWTPNWESFLIVPSIPKSINRYAQPLLREPDERDSSDAESATTVKVDAPQSTPCPRLSLNLGGMTAFFPSVMNLARLGMDDSNDEFLLRGSEGRRPMRKSRSFSFPQHTQLTQIAEEQGSDTDEHGHSLLGMRSRSTECLNRLRHRSDAQGSVNDESLGEDRTTLGSQGQLVLYDRAGTMAWLNRADDSSVYSAHSAETAVRLGGSGPCTPRIGRAYSPSSLPEVGSDIAQRENTPLSPSRSAILLSPALARPVIEYSPASLASSSQRVVASSAQAVHIPKGGTSLEYDKDGLAPGSRTRSSPEIPRAREASAGQSHDQTKRGGAGSSTASLSTEAAMQPGLQPAPLKVRKQCSPPSKTGEAERCSIMWQDLSDEINQKLAEFGKFTDASISDEGLIKRTAEARPAAALTPISKVRRSSLGGEPPSNPFRESERTEQAIPQQRSASAAITPSSSKITLDSARVPSFTIADLQTESGFTPSGRKRESRHSALPDSPTLPAQDSPGREMPPMESLARRRRLEKRRGLMSPRSKLQLESSAPQETRRSVSSPAIHGSASGSSSSRAGYSTTAKTLSHKDSSFALNESKGKDAVTLLPRLDESTPRVKPAGSHIPVPVSPATYFDQSPGHRGKRRGAALPATTPLAFQRFDTAARLATVAANAGTRKSSSSSTDKDVRTGRGPSSFSNLLRKYSRSKMDDSGADTSGASTEELSGREKTRSASSSTVRAEQTPRRLHKASSEAHALRVHTMQQNHAREVLTTSSESLMGLQSFIDRQSPSQSPSSQGVASMSSAAKEVRSHTTSEPTQRVKTSLGRRADARPGRKLQKASKENLRSTGPSSRRL
ncbi:cytochrome P450 312a1 [Purpureocillium lavendulum]|uniref:Cytochrome P450 312a1 n=1 Tax=Purpureocillium lavendulum TaxID=1247861 RepID=A0AB34FSU2_9HYPO|nr:cytochrome P450 312a1 [Purpureocillium lavendulum]